MNNLKLFFNLFKKNSLLALILVLIVTASMIVLSTSVANYRYSVYPLQFMENETIRNSTVVFNRFDRRFSEENSELSQTNYGKYTEELKKAHDKFMEEDVPQKCKNFSAVKNVYNFYYNCCDPCIYFASEETYNIFDYKLSSGSWFKDTPQTSEYPNAVLNGHKYKDVEVGSDIEIEYFGNGQSRTVKVHVIGKVASPYYLFANGIYLEYYPQTVFLLNNDFTMSKFSGILYNSDISPMFITFNDNATQDEIDEVYEYLKPFFETSMSTEFSEMSELIKHQYDILDDWIQSQRIIDLTAVFMSLAALIFIPVMMLKSRFKHSNIYTQQSFKKNLTVVSLGIFSLSLIPELLTLLYLYLHTVPYAECRDVLSGFAGLIIYNNDIRNTLNTVFIDEYSYIYTLVYVVTAAIISFSVSFIMLKKHQKQNGSDKLNEKS